MSDYDAMTIDELMAENRHAEVYDMYDIWRSTRTQLDKRLAVKHALLDLSEDLSEQGLVVVPEKPTTEMLAASSGLDGLTHGEHPMDSSFLADDAECRIWSTMIAAATSPGETGNG